MARTRPGQFSFNGGELSPHLAARADLAKYRTGAQRMENMVPTVQGPARRRGGSRFVGQTKSDGHVWIAKFSFSRTQSYLLEFGDQYIRFYAGRAQLKVGSNFLEVAAPYTLAQLTNEDGCFALDVQLDRDVLYITSGDHPPKMLRRLGAIDFELVDFVSKNGPMQDINGDKSLRIYASSRTDESILHASADFFTESMVGAYIRLDIENFKNPPWETLKHFVNGAEVRSDGKTYFATSNVANQVSGTNKPIHEYGRVIDGSGETSEDTPRPIGIEWEYRDSGYGYGRITIVSDARTANIQVDPDFPLPSLVVGINNPTNVWQIGAWGTHAGAEWPRHVCKWKGRLCMFGLRTGWLSVPSDYTNFARDIVGQVRADCAIILELDTTEVIRWVDPNAVILVGTEAGEWVIDKQTPTEALGPTNIDAYERTFFGSRALRPVRVGDTELFAETAGERVRQAIYDPQAGTLEAPDITVYADGITRGGIVDWAWAPQPDSALWAVLSTGELIGCTVQRDQEVLAWHRHPTNGFVEAVEVLPSPDGSRDDVWVVVRRTIAGVPKRFVEYLDVGDVDGRSQADCFFLDAGLSYSGAPATVIGGLLHMAGASVDILVDGAVHPSKVVSSGGNVTLNAPASKVHVGLGFRSVLHPMPLDPGDGSSIGATQRVTELAIRFHRTLGGKVGPSLDQLSPLLYRKGSDPLGHAPPLFTGTSEPIAFEGDYTVEAGVYLVQDQPLPMEVCAIVPKLESNAGS